MNKEKKIELLKLGKIKVIHKSSVESIIGEIFNKDENTNWFIKEINLKKNNFLIFIFVEERFISLRISLNLSEKIENLKNFAKIFSDKSKTDDEILESVKENGFEIAEIEYEKKEDLKFNDEEIKEKYQEVSRKKRSFYVYSSYYYNVYYSEEFCKKNRYESFFSFFESYKNDYVKIFATRLKGSRFSNPKYLCSIYEGYRSFFTNVKQVEFSKCTKIIDRGAFYNCENLEKVILTDSIRKIRNSAFYNCKNLKSITIPKELLIIGKRAFKNCVNLKCALDFMNIKSLKDFGKEAFLGCVDW